MSRKGVIAKRVKAAPDSYIENQRPNAQSGWPRNACSALGQSYIRPTEVSAKVQTDRPITQRPGKHCPAVGQANHATPRTTSARAGKQASRPRNPHVPRPMHPSEPGKNVPRPAEKPSAKSLRRPSRPTMKHPATTVPTRPKTRLSGRSSRPTVRTPRSTRSRF
ncbi:unnamed protein product [Microthlaspi erraticum]|uniref:Uncharacterized protein n=1 Tax=Microthlaspi erraticum TaxID=1685480 RepID=A0A6D2IWB3_9BRAS|nr:unnamed protein product [Microthlaspi erraticum]